MPLKNILPLPKKVSISRGTLNLNLIKDLEYFYPEPDKRIEKILAQLHTSLKCIDSPSKATLSLHIADISALPTGLEPELKKQAYQISISSEGIELIAPEQVGLSYGLRTLIQLFEKGLSIPCCTIIDWPDMPLRGQHLTLGSGYMPSYTEMIKIIQQMAAFKMNSFTIEYDGSFPWESYPFIAQSMALTKNQYRELIKIANENFIDCIPLIDSLGHQEHYLCHDQLKELRELPDSIAELCPSNPKSLEFIKTLWTEVLDVHKGCEYVNITGDETFRLGRFCSKCKPYANEGRLANLYYDYYIDLIRWMLDRGHRPMMWHDMLVKHPQLIKEFPKELIIIDWNYYGSDASHWNFTCSPTGSITKEELGSVPKDTRNLFEQYWLQKSTAPDFTPWPYVKFFIDQGFEVLGASAGSVNINGDTPFPGFASRIANAKSFARTIAQNNGKGLLHTFWSTYTSIFTSWSNIAAAADYSWHSREEKTDQFLDRFDSVYLGGNGKFRPAAEKFDALVFPNDPEFNIVESIPDTASDESLRKLFLEAANSSKKNQDYLEMLEPSLLFSSAKNDLKRRSIEQFNSQIPKGIDEIISIESAVNCSTEKLPLHAHPKLPVKHGAFSVNGIKLQVLTAENKALNTIAVNGENAENVPDQINEIEVNTNYDMLFFLHTGFYTKSQDHVADYIIHYEDGKSASVAIVGNQNIGDWFAGPEVLPDAITAWSSYSKGREQKRLSMYLVAWKNPYPELKIKNIEILSQKSKGHLILLSITGRKFKEKTKSGLFDQFDSEFRKAFNNKCAPAHIEKALELLGVEELKEQEKLID